MLKRFRENGNIEDDKIKISFEYHDDRWEEFSKEVPEYEYVLTGIDFTSNQLGDDIEKLSKINTPIRHIIINDSCEVDKKANWSEILKKSVESISIKNSTYFIRNHLKEWSLYLIDWFPNLKKIIYDYPYNDGCSILEPLLKFQSEEEVQLRNLSGEEISLEFDLK